MLGVQMHRSDGFSFIDMVNRSPSPRDFKRYLATIMKLLLSASFVFLCEVATGGCSLAEQRPIVTTESLLPRSVWPSNFTPFENVSESEWRETISVNDFSDISEPRLARDISSLPRLASKFGVARGTRRQRLFTMGAIQKLPAS